MSNEQPLPTFSSPLSPWHPTLILTAIGFLTRITMPKWVGFSPQDVAHSTRWFSLVGVVVGSVLALCLWLLTPLFGQAIAAALTLIVGWRLTGAFHEDGLADLCDGFGGSWQRQRKLDIMKDSQIGTYGVLAVVGSVILKLLVLTQLPINLAVMGLICSHAGARACVGCVPAYLSYARVDQPSKTPQSQLPPSKAVLATLISIACLPLFLLPLTVAIIVCFSWLSSCYFMLRLMKQHIQGYTGDTLGATEQVVEIMTLLTLVLINNIGMYSHV